MPSLLIRDIDEATKRSLAVRAAQNGRSQQAEARAIIETALDNQPKSWVQLLREKSIPVGGIDLPEPQRHVPRLTGIQL
ncbi:FitA-like ribbon-helix-helix domain-containing protein [Adlercreutzia murintestinalis]|uniref:FitA-like ribbon-helix-helix domain-containing protein n=1 Tax=Adlercreutzia murintestinalis TaxID=2941325 RepID=UPI003D80BAB0